MEKRAVIDESCTPPETGTPPPPEKQATVTTTDPQRLAELAQHPTQRLAVRAAGELKPVPPPAAGT